MVAILDFFEEFFSEGEYGFETRKFMLTVSLCAMLAVNPVLADVPKEKESVGDSHTVYTQETFEGRMDSGIAGVTYVNKAMDAAGNAAQKAEGHAAAAGASALSAAESAGEAAKSAKAANDALSGKVDKKQGTGNKNKVMVTNSDGTVYPGYVTPDNITTTFTDGSGHALTGLNGDVLVINGNGRVVWGRIGSKAIAVGAVTSSKIAGEAISASHIPSGTIYSGHIATGTITAGHITSSG